MSNHLFFFPFYNMNYSLSSVLDQSTLISNCIFFNVLFLFNQSLVIANAGLGNGMSRHQLHRIVDNYGVVETLLMPPNKPYSFVQYESTEEAKKAFNALNGKEVTLEDFDQNIVLYCNFVEKGIIFVLICKLLPQHFSLLFFFLGCKCS